jgi:hypothetical protein
MNSLDRQLDCLMQSAARAPRALPTEPSFAMESRVLGYWRRLPTGAGDLAQVLLPLLRRAALCACLLMLLSLAFGYEALLTVDNDEVTLANSAVDLTLVP